jgi:hypothetical protein
MYIHDRKEVISRDVIYNKVKIKSKEPLGQKHG